MITYCLAHSAHMFDTVSFRSQWIVAMQVIDFISITYKVVSLLQFFLRVTSTTESFFSSLHSVLYRHFTILYCLTNFRNDPEKVENVNAFSLKIWCFSFKTQRQEQGRNHKGIVYRRLKCCILVWKCVSIMRLNVLQS